MRRAILLFLVIAFIFPLASATAQSLPSDIAQQTRIMKVTDALMQGEIVSAFAESAFSLGDYWHKAADPLVSVLFLHITAFLAIYAILGVIIKKAVFEKITLMFKVFYLFLLPLLVLGITLLLPSI